MVLNLFILPVNSYSSIFFLKEISTSYVSSENASHVYLVCGFSQEIDTQSKEYANHECTEYEREDIMHNLKIPQYYKHSLKCAT